MSNVGKTFPSEMTTYTDPKSGREIVQLTKTGCNIHMYFTDNSFTLGDKEILYTRSETSLGEKGYCANLFKMDLETGVRTQMTDFAGVFHSFGNFTKSPDSKVIVFSGDGNLYALNPVDGSYRLLFTTPAGFTLGARHISYDSRYVAVVLNDEIPQKYDTHENYNGFKESFYAHKISQIWMVAIDGSCQKMLVEDTHWCGHVQWAPDTNEYISYCHEGPWNYVQQRIWVLNTLTGHVKPCFVQEEDDSIGHEFWTHDGLIFFDNRGRGHDGTITSDKTQAVTVSADGPDAIPWVGFADKECHLLRRIDLPYYCNHYHANIENTKLVADAVNDIVLIDIGSEQPSLEVLCEHDTSWRYQGAHCHPCWSWSNDKILYASDKDAEGCTQLYMIRMK